MTRFFHVFLGFQLLSLAMWGLAAVSVHAAGDMRAEPPPVDTNESGIANESDAFIRAANQMQIDQILRDYPGGERLSDNEVAWNEGSVVLVLPTLQAQTCYPWSGCVHGCPPGWYCFYEHWEFGGRRLQFSDCSPGGTTQSLRDYGFENQTSSWVVNRSLNFVNVNDSEGGGNLWNADSHSVSTWVGPEANDRADWFICYE